VGGPGRPLRADQDRLRSDDRRGARRLGSRAAQGRLIAWSILLTLSALAVLAGALRLRAVLPALAAAAGIATAWFAPLAAVALTLVALALLGLGSLVWRLLDD
jgi:hypothetical protein